MTPFENLARFLEPDYDSNYWSDDAVLHAEDLIFQLASEDWRKVSEGWRTRKAGWQERLADALAGGKPDFAYPLLRQMLLSPMDSVAAKAGESIRSILQNKYEGSLNAEEVARIKHLMKMNRLYEMVFGDLIKKFGADEANDRNR